MQPSRFIEKHLDNILSDLPKMPSQLRYYDTFNDKLVTVDNPYQTDIWELSKGGNIENMDFSVFSNELKLIMKAWFYDQLISFAVSTALGRYYAIKSIPEDIVSKVLVSTPLKLKNDWDLFLVGDPTRSQSDSLKALMHYLCKFSLGHWTSEYKNFLNTLPVVFYDKYAKVRAGDVFLKIEEEAKLVAYLDEVSQLCISNNHSKLRKSAMVLCAYQFGMRPTQIAMLRMSDIKLWTEIDEKNPPVHLTFRKIKQRSLIQSIPLVRPVKKEWASILSSLFNIQLKNGLRGDGFLFEASANEVSNIIIEETTTILNQSRTATDLRHSAAQRLVDAGASHEELAEFMGHSDIDTGLVYYTTSKNQAERVNSALGISDIYLSVAKIAHDGFISESELDSLKGDNQIGAVPHGFEIAGIGGCSTGQSSCQFNPVTSCYGCRKFMPLNNAKIHNIVLENMRTIVVQFDGASKGGQESSAYLQLKRTISNIQAIILEVSEDKQ